MVTIITITIGLLASVEQNIVLMTGVRTVSKLHLLFQLMASVNKGHMAGFLSGEYSVQVDVDVDTL
jgi:hypothetical protein